MVLASILAPAFGMTDQEFIGILRKNIPLLEGQINGWNKERATRCPQQKNAAEKEACVAGFNLIISRHRAEQDMNELRISGIGLDNDRRAYIARLVSGDGVAAYNKETLELEAILRVMFPMPK